ncbi:acylphosphatase [Klebsiella sp. BIGb0407]|uniref:acylphosphatase n=1 Tax=Klebsiella sp. BIGb0407 TaxID=2940603 RepID=UPI002169E62B|nr:acylphosphatase [Klebsiella sp. BIGb0407]MCS3430715.1 acylphosphatase [Klebsiella sp. BIGb0407]
MTGSQQQCVKYRVYGRVQGVGFRYSVWREAQQLALTGYARNLDDGSVEVLACGSSDQLEKLLSWLNAGGPRGARVDNVFSATHQPEQHWTEFKVRY